jgi:uncharacterized protein YozE (UPF0346 family)
MKIRVMTNQQRAIINFNERNSVFSMDLSAFDSLWSKKEI